MLSTSLATGACYGLGDILAQTVEIKQDRRKEYDWHRTGVFTVFATVMAGPIYYVWFRKIDTMPQLINRVVKWNQERQLAQEFRKQLSIRLQKGDIENMSMKVFREQFKHRFEAYNNRVIHSKTVLVCKVYADQFIFSTIYPVFFLMVTGILLANTTKEDYEYIKQHKRLNMEKINKSISDSWHNLKQKYLRIYMMDCAVWPLAQMANFAFIPSHFHAIFVNVLNIFWNTFICYVSQDATH